MITTCGFLIFAISILMLLYFLVVHFMGRTVHGWTSTIVSIWAIGGLQLPGQEDGISAFGEGQNV